MSDWGAEDKQCHANGCVRNDVFRIVSLHHCAVIVLLAYLKNNGVDNKTKYNQVANYIYLDTQVNKAISDDTPSVYFARAKKQCTTKVVELGNISDENLLSSNLAENCIPSNIADMDVSMYDEFLSVRRKLMAALIEKYYKNI